MFGATRFEASAQAMRRDRDRFDEKKGATAALGAHSKGNLQGFCLPKAAYLKLKWSKVPQELVWFQILIPTSL